MVSGRINSLYVCTMTLMFFSTEQLQAQKCLQSYFKKRHIGDSLSALHVISNHSVSSEALCSHYCLKEEICVGFNYKEKHNNECIENCQLSNSKYDDMKNDGRGNGDWVYFEEIQTIKSNNSDTKGEGNFLPVNRAAGVKMKIWFNITDDSVDKLYSDPRYPDNHDNVTILSSFDTGQKFADNYGCKLSALYKALETGNYTLSAACDNTCDVFWGEMRNSTNQKRIISLRMTTGYKQWNKTPKQQSKPIYMEKDRFYRIEAALKEGLKDDYLIIGVQQPNGTFVVPIPSKQLFYEM